ncbi:MULTISPECIES: hypothetical protein [Paenibacillus]|uniref:hypothetical protein n=1 Tax=Paenibacillus TaxID=44249 RepID=UPI0020B75865|nr:hypothetical protein [Paenibacillus sp. CH40]MCP3796873.1 hypothetical protein [Paenibacillus sp. CH40]
MKKSSDVVVEETGTKEIQVVHGAGEAVLSGPPPRVEGSSDRCCRWIPGLE